MIYVNSKIDRTWKGDKILERLMDEMLENYDNNFEAVLKDNYDGVCVVLEDWRYRDLVFSISEYHNAWAMNGGDMTDEEYLKNYKIISEERIKNRVQPYLFSNV